MGVDEVQDAAWQRCQQDLFSKKKKEFGIWSHANKNQAGLGEGTRGW